MTRKIYLLQRSHRVTIDDFGKQRVSFSEYESLEQAQESMEAIDGSCLIIRGEIIDHNCRED